MKNINSKILCIGAGYIGGPTMAVIAKMNPDKEIYVADINEERIAAWNSSNLPVYEPGLQEIVEEVRDVNLHFTTDVDRYIEECDTIFIGVNTPTKTYGNGAGKASDLSFWEKAARNIAQHSTRNKIIVEKSTLPVRTADALNKVLKSNSEVHFEIVSNPEFLAEGTAIKDLLNPDRVLIGGNSTDEGKLAVEAVSKIYEAWVPKEKIITTNLWSSEMSKLAANAMLAQRVSSINAFSALCEKTDANIDEVAKVIGADSRIGNKFLKAGPGFGGSCFKKDVLNLIYLCESYGLTEPAKYWQAVLDMNEWQQKRIVSRLLEQMFNTAAGKKIAVFGYAFKANTGDIRETPSKTVVLELLKEKARVMITDPKALQNASLDIGKLDDVFFTESPYDAARNADAIIIMTDWAEYQTLDWNRIYQNMKKPAYLFDARNILDERRMFGLGFNYSHIG